MFLIFLYCSLDCLSSLGVSTSRIIPDADITASTQYNSQHAPLGGRLHFQDQINSQGQITQIGGWAAAVNDVNQFLQIKFGQIYQISGVATQSRADSNQWVKSYKLQYSTDGSSWTDYPNVSKFYYYVLPSCATVFNIHDKSHGWR